RHRHAVRVPALYRERPLLPRSSADRRLLAPGWSRPEPSLVRCGHGRGQHLQILHALSIPVPTRGASYGVHSSRFSCLSNNGRIRIKRLPSPSMPLLTTWIVPPWRCRSSATTYRPSPTPLVPLPSVLGAR